MERKRILITVLLSVLSCAAAAQSSVNVIAHRGWHKNNGCPENSIAAFKASQELGVWGSEFDIWLTADGKVVVNHNRRYDMDPFKRVIMKTRWRKVRDLRLENDEKVPTFVKFVKQAKKDKSIMMVCEMKDHDDELRNRELVDAAYMILKRHHLENQIVMQGFNWEMVCYVAKACPGVKAVYICSDSKQMKTAREVADAGLSGINYRFSLYDSNPGLISQCHELGLTACLTAQDDMKIQERFIKAGIDAIGTNDPVRLMELLGLR
ncbi:MAG: hypothetical protein HUJ94_02480 [Bacteroidales bacterium]|nr:hypothetical protein [Bacteroidales bacterium]